MRLLPRPVERPHPPIWIAVVMTPQPIRWAGEPDHGLMVVPFLSDFDRLAESLMQPRSRIMRKQRTGELVIVSRSIAI